uniref:Uncharacterized protein n=1 Tax=Micrurus spixii TaxID=129469 RepID=A0A2D4MKI5_9SAUR
MPTYFVLRNQFPVQNTETIIIKLQPSSDAQKSAYQGEMGFFAVFPQPPHGMRKLTLQLLVTKRAYKRGFVFTRYRSSQVQLGKNQIPPSCILLCTNKSPSIKNTLCMN